MRLSRPLIALCTIAPLVLTAAACSDSSGGQIRGTNGPHFSQTVNDPVQIEGACHHLAPRGLTQVTNTTGIDIVLHKGANCDDPGGVPGAYLSTTLSIKAGPGQGPWRSFVTVGQAPPVPVNSSLG
ncbi:hypothetical protein GA0115240_132730 [Streptomyces sp. DvalAA-14]|uniref:hypothetical protein n=1 Tax=unclassified Streptomyces TaxID=2593676 RepID=UPI00081B784A|nr:MULTISPECIES: hypothetical protein [unclassified Streptomyces]MYS21589.1 hypothetical protein [Streptomyces sp. SID4948]SCD96181.1 hypothetical protein GA0115240_132730 [Streptomyces sp. DvalAA-14]